MFRTELTIAPQERLLPRTARVLTVGSCFADSIGERLRLNKVNALVNPFGTVFQPLALAQLLRAAAGEEQDWQQHVVEARGRWQSYDFHGTIGAESPVELLQTIQETVRRVGDFVRTANAVILTLGTAWAYRLRETGELVSNLHKLPAGLFEKELLTADEIVNGLAEVHALLRRMNPAIRIVLTVSPVRHIKDTLPLNAVSKSVLRVACHYLSELLPNVSYFPAYELLTDDLRDYRFYAADMLHPSEVAEDYIWERFARAYFDADFGRFRKEWAAVRQSLGHRPLHPGAPEHRAFLDQTRERLERMTSQGVDVRQELRDVQRQLAALPPPRPVRVPEVEVVDDEERIDIGSDEADSASPTLLPPTETAPQQNRRHENRRDGRRNDRTSRDRRDNRPAPVALPASEEPVAPAEALPQESVAAEVEALLTNPEVELLVAVSEEGIGYPAKKKKRRSRGGAKRTARKNAARLAAEQEGSQLSPDEAEEPTEEVTEESATYSETFEAPAAAEGVFAGPLALAELPNEVASEPDNDLGTETTPERPAEAPAPVSPEQPAPIRKRGTGPTPKKSKVITKSALVKRGKRTSLYRSPTAEAAEVPALEPAAEPATAPIISPPIIPEVLLERPAVALAEFPPSEPEVEEFAAEVAADTAPAKPKRGRPKAARQPAASADNPAPNEAEMTDPSTEAAPAALDASEEASSDKPATKAKPRAARAAKAATPKKPAAKADTPRRGRPPGKKTPPAAPEAPAA
ncbi:GSCFA domain-containing protein [Hymenobacter sp. BT559]|uniref:GSCFA domain-containing protein n=1 Tax=Hymenobacter sp. BT559 TaxID=2795729 RepID=UPI0018EE2394|nr:GSCFA domain-containing protein [Hymenobacter sp. BT559]MBJ6143504.1 GSCFA domain-containing protein [Hymenobacter sp. BT559]